MQTNLHSPERRLIELMMAHADLDALIDAAAQALPIDELDLRRMKKRRLVMRDEMHRLRVQLQPDAPA